MLHIPNDTVLVMALRYHAEYKFKQTVFEINWNKEKQLRKYTGTGSLHLPFHYKQNTPNGLCRVTSLITIKEGKLMGLISCIINDV